MEKIKVYLDHNATTPPHPEVVESVPAWLKAWGNPSSIHQAGREPKRLIREARQEIAQFLSVDPLEVVFTSCGSESNALALRGGFLAVQETQPHRKKVIISSIEHPALRSNAYELMRFGAEVIEIKVDRRGVFDLEKFESLLDEQTALVSVMFANNETGTILPLGKICRRAKQVGALVHSDCVQALGKVPLSLGGLGIDMASFSAHKFYALRGCGVLYVRKGTPLRPQIIGGAQERHRRAGTENTLAISSLGLMCKISKEAHWQKMNEQAQLRDLFESLVLDRLPNVTITAAESPRLPNTSSLVIAGVDGETLLMSLDLKGFAVSTGAACSSGSPEPSPSLLALGLEPIEAQSSLRVSLGMFTTNEQILDFVEVLCETVKQLRTKTFRPAVMYGA